MSENLWQQALAGNEAAGWATCGPNSAEPARAEVQLTESGNRPGHEERKRLNRGGGETDGPGNFAEAPFSKAWPKAPGKKNGKASLIIYSRNVTRWGPLLENRLKETSCADEMVDIYAWQATHKNAEDTPAAAVVCECVGWSPVFAPAVPGKRGDKIEGAAAMARCNLQSFSYRHLAARESAKGLAGKMGVEMPRLARLIS